MDRRLRVHEFDSSAIGRGAYDIAARTLDLSYKGGDRYRYFGVPEEVFDALLAASSASEFVNREIKPHYRCDIGRHRFRPD